jgi:hypothetical protein
VTHHELLRPRHHHKEQLHYHCVHEQLSSDSTTSPFAPPSHPPREECEPQHATTRVVAGDEEGHA